MTQPMSLCPTAFQSERELQDELARLELGIDGLFTATFLRREVPIGGRIPDLIYVRFLMVPDSRLWPRRLNFRHSYVLWLLRQQSQIRPETIADRSYEPIDKVMPVLRDLIRSGAVIKLETGTLALSEEMASITAEVIAVEAKLHRWREALTQAMTYSSFANRVFVAMDYRKTPSAPEIIDQFLRNGIGLCAVAPKSLKWLVLPPLVNRPLGPEREYLITSAVASTHQQLWSRR